MRARTPSTSAERALEEYSRAFQARTRGREPERLPLQDGYAPLLIDGPADSGGSGGLLRADSARSAVSRKATNGVI